MVSLSLLQGIFPTQGLNWSLLHCRQILYQLSHQGSPRILESVSLSLLQWIFPTQESNQGVLHYRQILYTELSGKLTTRRTISKQLLEQISPQAVGTLFWCLPPYRKESGREEKITVQNTRFLWGVTFAFHFFEGTTLILSLKEPIGGAGSHSKPFFTAAKYMLWTSYMMQYWAECIHF